MLSNLTTSHWASQAYDIDCQFGKNDSQVIRRRLRPLFSVVINNPVFGNFFRSRYTAMTTSLNTRCILPDLPWDQVLFKAPPSYGRPRHNLTAEWVDLRLRQIRRMPSTGDNAEKEALEGLGQLYHAQRTALLRRQETSIWFAANPSVFLWNQVRRLIDRLQDKPGRVEAHMLDRLAPTLVHEGLLPALPHADARLSDLIDLLNAAELILLDRIARTTSGLKRPYLKRMVRIMTAALNYNVTADTTRIEPVLTWIKTILPRYPLSSAAYADVGCSFATGAKNTILAAHQLRPEYARAIHGVDILPPDTVLQRNLLSRHRILLYQADPLHHPLPRTYQAILLANVHRHLTRDDQQALFTHLGSSLIDGGHLFINWRFDQSQSPCICLQRQNRRMELLAEHNCV